MNINRRHMLMGMGGAAAAGLAGSLPAFAETKKLTVAAYAGLFEKSLRASFGDNFVKTSGIDVEYSIGATGQWIAQVDALPANPPLDMFFATADDVIRGGRAGIYDTFSVDKIPNMADVPTALVDFCKGWGCAFDFGINGGFTYNSDTIKNPPKSIVEFIDRTIKGEWKASLPTLTWQHIYASLIWSFTDALGGTVEDVSPFFDALHKMKPNCIFWNGLNEALTQLDSGDCDIAIYGDGRTYDHYDSGAKWIRFGIPEEKGIINPVCFVKPKNAKPEAFQFINACLDPAGQAIFSGMTSYGMSNGKVVYPDKVKDRVARLENARLGPFERIAQLKSEWADRWNKEMAS
jgi:putative spermidine/putrescine transport system substrate-binding protein